MTNSNHALVQEYPIELDVQPGKDGQDEMEED